MTELRKDGQGLFWFSNKTWKDYEQVPWWRINEGSKRVIMRHLLPMPDACPVCKVPSAESYRGPIRGFLILCNKSGKHEQDPNDWYWICRSCNWKAKHPQPFRHPALPGSKMKPWSELTRQSKMFRIKRALPIPDACPYCDSTTVELVSRSGTWPEDVNDYVWCCRKHGRVFPHLANYHTAKTPYWKVRERAIQYEAMRALMAHWYNVTMPGTFLGHSILNKTCAGGRFYTTPDTFVEQLLR